MSTTVIRTVVHSVSNEFELVYPQSGSKLLVDEEPAGRSGHCMVQDESGLYVFGGFNPLGRCVVGLGTVVAVNQSRPTVLDELWKFNFGTEKWTKMEASGCPKSCASSCLVMQGPNLYVFGGTSYPFGQHSGNTLFVCNVARPSRTLLSSCSGQVPSAELCYQWNRWEDNSPDEMDDDDENKPPKGYGQSIIFHDHYLYTFGGAVGFYNEAIGDLYRQDLTTRTWEKLTPTGECPVGRYKQEIIQDDQGFFIMGGGRLHMAMPVHILYRYIFAYNTWVKVTTVPDPTFGNPKPRSAFGFVHVDSDVYICGGSLYGINNQPHQVLQDLWHLSLLTLRWTQLSVSLPEPVYFHRACVSPSRHLYLYGGVVTGGRRSGKLYRYRLPLQVAKLSEVCWVRVCGLWKDGLENADPQELVQTYGIPSKFVQRLV